MANLTREETKLFLYEAHRNEVLNDVELNTLLEAVEDAEYVSDLEEIVESVNGLINEEEPEEDNVLESVNEFLQSRADYRENMTESKNETKLNIFEAAKDGLISEEEKDKLLEIVESVEF